MDFKKIKEIRKEKGYTLAQMSQETGFTASFLSQMERGLKNPSLETLRKISDCLEVPLINFFIEGGNDAKIKSRGEERGKVGNVILKEDRREILIPNIFTKCEFITPTDFDNKNNKAVVGFIVNLEQEHWISEKMVNHSSDESTYIIRGSMKVYIGDEVYLLQGGDSLYIEANTPHNWQNCGEGILETISYMRSGY